MTSAERPRAAAPSPVRGPCLAVVGSSGFLGAHAVASALAAGWGVLAVARRPGAVPAGAEAAALDAAEPGALESLLDARRPDAVLLCAALARGAECEADPAAAVRMNAELPERVARWCAERAARLLHVSTDLVFGASDAPRGGFDEDAPPAPAGVYGTSKAEGEGRVLAAAPGALVVRLPLLYGDSGGRGLGASDALLAAIERGLTPGLFEDEWRTPLEVSSAADALVELLAPEHATRAGRLHVAGAERIDRHALGLAVLAAAGIDAAGRVRRTTRAAAGLERSRPRDVSLDCARARALLRTPLPAIAAGLRRCARDDS